MKSFPNFYLYIEKKIIYSIDLNILKHNKLVIFMTIKDEIKKIRDNVYEIPGSYNKIVPARDLVFFVYRRTVHALGHK